MHKLAPGETGETTTGLPVATDSIPLAKRLLDWVVICAGSPLLLLAMLLIALYIKLVSRGPVFFRQHRIGHRERHFEMLKFRSMHVNADPSLHEDHTTMLLLNNLPLTKMDAQGDRRLIPLGWLLRSSGLDELPQILNILRGDMSLVGPRPCTDYELERLAPEHRGRFAVLPGMTGLWQVSGKNRTTYPEMIALDERYARDWAIGLDLKIIVRTLPVLIGQIIEMLQSRFQKAKP